MTEQDWLKYKPYFDKSEFDCQETGENEMQLEFIDSLYRLRIQYNKPMIITSGYRSPMHSLEVGKPKPGAHSMGIACDIAVSGENAMDMLHLALAHGFAGVGVNQRGNSRFIHLDMGTVADGLPRPNIWSY